MCDAFFSRQQQAEVETVQESVDLRHGFSVEVFPYSSVDKQQARIGMVHDVVDVVGLEFMKDGDRHGSIGE